MTASLRFRAAIVSIALFVAFIGIWHIATRGTGAVATMTPEYAKLMGLTATQGKSAMPGPLDVATKLWEHLKRPLYDNGPNDKGLGIQLGYSIARVGLGYFLAVMVAIPLGFLIGMSPLINKALDPFIQILKPISPLAWMPLALYTIKDSGLSAIFVIFICSVWPMLLNTAFGVAAVRKEWINVARTLEVGTVRRAFTVILPAAAPTILTGMRISIGIAWLAIVAAEMLVGGTGIGYFVWNEWNNLSITNVIIAILVIGVVGMLLDQILARFTRMVTFPEGSDDRQIHFHRRYRKTLSGRRWRRDRGVRKSLAVDGARRIRLRDRPFRLRQDHGAERSRRARPAERRHRDRGRTSDRGHQPRPRRDFPEPRAAAVAHRARQRRLCRDLEMAGLGPGQGQGARADLHRSGRAHRRRAQATVGTVGRHEAARRHCARAQHHAEDHADG